MVMKSKKELRKTYREKHKELYGGYPETKSNLSDGAGSSPKFALKETGYKIINQKGAFGNKKTNTDGKIYQTYDKSNKERFMERKAKRISAEKSKSIVREGVNGLLTKVLG